jgi:hypothetical protein
MLLQPAPAVTALQSIVVALATPLLLLSADLSVILKRTGLMLRAFVCGAIGTALGALLGVWLVRTAHLLRARVHKGGGDEREFIGPLHMDTSLAHILTDVALALHAKGCDSCPHPRKPILCHYQVLLHSPDTCSSSSSCSDAMRMRVLAAFAAPHSLQDLFLNKTLCY